MAYRVSLTPRAERDLDDLYQDIRAEESPAARKWYAGLKRAILSLENLPNRNPATQESRALRHLLYGRRPHVYRVVYRVVESSRDVEVLHIRHGARQGFSATDVS